MHPIAASWIDKSAVEGAAPRQPRSPESSWTDLLSCTPSAEDLIDMLPAVLVGRLKILELLA